MLLTSHKGAPVITEISSANGYRNPAPPKTPIISIMAQKIHFQREKYTTVYKIIMHSKYKGSMHTCANRKHRKSTHAPGA
jgi:hypothetical protein